MKRYEYQIIASDKSHALTLPGIDVLLLPVSDSAFSIRQTAYYITFALNINA